MIYWRYFKIRVAIIARNYTGGGSNRARAYKTFLASKNHHVDILDVTTVWPSKLHSLYERSLAYMKGDELRVMLKLSKYLERKIRTGKYDAVISVESPFSYVLTKDLGCLKIFSWESSWADELYFESYNKNCINFDRVREIRYKELEICEKADYVVFPWQSTENYIRRNIYNGSNFVTLRFGCYPKSNTVQFFFPASIVSVGAMHAHCQNAALLAYLTQISDYAIDVYGSKPDRRYKLNYKGFASSLDVLYNYQFGLNTISKDIYRQSHFSSRVLAYLAYGLPVLSPDWMQLSHELKGCLPYNEDNFVDLIDKYSKRQEWEKLSKEAYNQACQLDWNNTLRPLEEMICKC